MRRSLVLTTIGVGVHLRSLIPLFFYIATPSSSSAAPDEMGQRLERWFRARTHAHLRYDSTLAAAAVENSRAIAELPSHGGRGERVGVTDYLQFVLERHQVRDAVVLALSGRFSDPERLWRRLVAFLGERAEGLTHYGIGLSGEGDKYPLTATLILVRRRVEVGSLRAVRGRPLELCGAVKDAGELRVLATTPSGRVLESRPARQCAASTTAGKPRVVGQNGEWSRFCAAFKWAEQGRYQMEVMVDGAFGPEVAALFPLFVGEAPPALPVHKVYPPATLDRDSAEQDLLMRLQRARRQAGLQPLSPRAELHRMARRHSADMRDRGFFGHRSPRRGSLGRRLAEEQLSYVQASENLALSTSPQRAHDALLASPAHRRNLLDPALTDVGIGVAVDAGRGLLYITQCFARISDQP